MRRKDKKGNIINIIRDRLEKEVKRLMSEGGKITPYNIMEGLKGPVDDESGLTRVGRLLKESLKDGRMIDAISWIAFHFEFPGREFSYSEWDMRNWVAVRSDDQELLNKIYDKVRAPAHELKEYYAPSLLLAQMSESLSKKNKLSKLLKELRERWWLYKFTDEKDAFRACFNGDARDAEELENMEMIFFEEGEAPGGKAVKLTFCPPVLNNRTDFTLGDLLNEAEADSLRKFNIFRETLQQFSKVGLNCDDYAGVPLFFYGSEQKYVTDIYVALSHERENGKIARVLEIDDIMQILNDITPHLKTCVSLINSQVAYSLGEVTRRDKMAGLLHAVIRHDINNFAVAVDSSISQLAEYGDVLEEEETLEIVKEIRANVALSTMCVDLDFLWSAEVKNSPDNFTAIRGIKEDLDKSWRFTSVLNCEFSGDWSSDVLAPKVCRIVLSNLLRNAINNNDSAEIRLDCRLEAERVDFGCLSEKEFSEFWRRQTFEEPLALKIPACNKGLWICRYIVKSLGGEFYLAPGRGNYKTHIRFNIPII